jgi:hypothetical protein
MRPRRHGRVLTRIGWIALTPIALLSVLIVSIAWMAAFDVVYRIASLWTGAPR